jgi:hypothetical protein
MKVSVTFVGEDGAWVVVDRRDRDPRALDAARVQLGATIQDVRFYPASRQSHITCTLNDAQARRAGGAFAAATAATVVVPPASLNRYIIIEWRPLPENETTAVCNYTVDSERLVEDWLSAGAPVAWNPLANNHAFGTISETNSSF